MRKICLMSLIFLSLFLIAGCSKAGETLAELKEELQEDVAAPVPERAELKEDIEHEQPEIPNMDDLTIEETYEPVQTISPVQGQNGEKITVNLYFADTSGNALVKTEKQIAKVEGLARATLETLLLGPERESGLQSAIPEGTKLLDINIKQAEKLCIVDFSKELATKGSGTGISEEVAVYSIANTLCQFPSIEKVEFRIEGQAITTLQGSTDLSRAVWANKELVR